MAIINFGRREIEAKIVYYGPALSGKTTNVKVVHASLPESQRGQLSTLATEDERTLYFDYAPITLGRIAGFTAQFKLFSVPGQAFYTETRKAVLKGADGVVFVADSAPERAEANIASLADLEHNLKANGMDIAELPLVIQLNKRDVPGALTVAALSEQLNRWGVPVVEAVALTGEGVDKTLRAITDQTAERIRDNLAGHKTAVAVTAVDRAESEDDASIILKQLAAIQAVRPMEVQRAREHLERGEVNTDDVDAFLFRNVQRDGAGGVTGKGLATPDPTEAPKTKIPKIPDLSLGLPTPANAEWVVAECSSATVNPRGALVAQLILKEKRSGKQAAITVTVEPRPQAMPSGGRTLPGATAPRLTQVADAEPPTAEVAKTELTRTPPKAEPPKAEPPKAEPPKAEPPKAEPPKAAAKAETPRPATKADGARVDSSRAETTASHRAPSAERRPKPSSPALPFPIWVIPAGIAGALLLGVAIGILLRT